MAESHVLFATELLPRYSSALASLLVFSDVALEMLQGCQASLLLGTSEPSHFAALIAEPASMIMALLFFLPLIQRLGTCLDHY